MIPRYTRPQMEAIWSPQNKYRIWFLIEAHATDKLAELGVVPQSAAEAVWKAKDVEFDVARIDEIEREVKHDVIAFLTHLAEHVGDEARFVHQGLTSSDVLDTCLAVQMRDAADLLLEGLDRLLPPGQLLIREPRQVSVRVRYLKPIEPPYGDGVRRDVVRALAGRVRTLLVDELERLRSERLQNRKTSAV